MLPPIGGVGVGFRNSMHVASREQRMWRSSAGFNPNVETRFLVGRCQVDEICATALRSECKRIVGSEAQRLLLSSER